MSVILPKTSPLAKEPEIRLEMLSEESFVLHKDDFNLHDEIIKACKHTGFQPHIVFETSQRDLMLQTVSADLAIALLPSRLCPEVGENTEVGSKVVVRPSCSRNHPYIICYLEKRSLPLPCFSLVVRLR